jgi:biotin-(acetyl-CoA carboxylase) ligase
MKPLPPPLAKRHKELLETLVAAETAMHEQGERIAAEDLATQALDFFILYAEYLAAHRDEHADGAWQAFLVDLVQRFTIQDEEGVVTNALAESGIEDCVLECCGVDDEDSAVRSSSERIKDLRDGLLDIRARQDEMNLF